MITIELTPSRRVTCRATFELPVSQSVVWGQLRDFRRFAAQDFFHAAVRVSPSGPRAGAALELDHRFGPFRTTRVGRILHWRELNGYSFSDLSPRGPRHAFPHVYRYRLRAASRVRCQVVITVAGLCKTQVLPRPLVRLWLAWVFSHIATSARNALLEQTSAAHGRERGGSVT
jgi:hypothetical protein